MSSSARSVAAELHDLVMAAADVGASDLHLRGGGAPIVRVDGTLAELHSTALERAEVASLVLALGAERGPEPEREDGTFDLALNLEGGLRLRVHVYETRRGAAIAVRLLPGRIPTLTECGLPPEVAALSEVRRGLVAVCGVTGSGKSTTIAALVDQARADRALHVVTIEDPIEYVYDSRHGLVGQREVGRHTPDFAQALKHALRADPDVIVVGELRDPESIELALIAAETGHVVFASVHAGSTGGAVDRLVHALPAGRWSCIRSQIAAVLEGVVYQELVALENQPGRRVACEVLRATPAVRQMIREGKTHQIPSVIEVSSEAGMRPLG